jgi:hypothetical protein
MQSAKGDRIRKRKELRLFQRMKGLEALDGQRNRFVVKNGLKKVISIGDTTTTDNISATVGLVRLQTYEIEKGKKDVAMGISNYDP